LFGATSNSINRTELLVLITPRVIRTEQDVREMGQDLKDRMKTLYPVGAAAQPQGDGPVSSFTTIKP